MGLLGTPKVPSRQTKILKLGNHLERSRGTIDGFSNLVDQRRRSVADESRALVNVHDSARFESHQARTGCVCGHWVVREHDLSQRARSTVKGTVSFHRHYAVRDNEMNGNRGTEIEDALLNALPVEDILRPSVSRSRHYAEHVLHAESDARPVMGLYFRHRHNKICFQHSPGEPEILHSCIARA